MLMATTKPRARKPKEAKTASVLLEALKFISVAQHSEGTNMQTHCRLSNGKLVAFDGGMAAGHDVDETLNCCPHTQTLVAALSRCQDSISITELDSGKLSIKSGKFRALVPCVPVDDLPGVEPDAQVATLTDDLKRALSAVLPLARDGLPDAFMCGVLVQAGTVVTTNRIVIIESWHGIDLPRILVPRPAALAVARSEKKLVGFGYSPQSVTFWFADNSFIKSQLFQDSFPKYNQVLDIECNPWPLPGGFYEAVETVLPFSEDNRLHFIDGKICSNPNTVEGTTYDVEGLSNGLIFNGELLKVIRPHAHRIAFNANERGMALFFDAEGLTRGAIMPIGRHGS
jgi:hypothetical protein